MCGRFGVSHITKSSGVFQKNVEKHQEKMWGVTEKKER